MENVSDLVRTFVIDAQAIDRQRASSQILHFRQLEETVKKIGEEIAELQGCEDAYKLQQDTARQISAYDALRYILQVEALQIGRAPSELQSLMRISYAVLCLKKNTNTPSQHTLTYHIQY